MEKKILDFIELNELTFIKGQRNSDSTILSGYALFVGIKSIEELIQIVEKYKKEKAKDLSHFDDYESELTKVFNYAKRHNYEKFWESEDAKTSFKF